MPFPEDPPSSLVHHGTAPTGRAGMRMRGSAPGTGLCCCPNFRDVPGVMARRLTPDVPHRRGRVAPAAASSSRSTSSSGSIPLGRACAGSDARSRRSSRRRRCRAACRRACWRWSITWAITPLATCVLPRPTSSATRKRRAGSSTIEHPLERPDGGASLEVLQLAQHLVGVNAPVVMATARRRRRSTPPTTAR